MQIGLATSTAFTADMERAFRRGLGRWNGITIAPRSAAAGDYDDNEGGLGAKQRLYQIMRALQVDRNVDLIIAAGGVVTAHAAVKERVTKPFVVLVGHGAQFLDETDRNYNYCGGINLNTISQNPARRRFLIDHYTSVPDTPNGVCLVWNQKSWMGKRQERPDWHHDGWPEERVQQNDTNEFTRVFDDVQRRGCRGVVISSDAFFSYRRDALVSEANNRPTLTVCYPSEVFLANSAPGRSMWYGPSLDQAYQALGAKTALILDDLDAGRPARKTHLANLPPSGPQYK
jgi:hypothetical protein